MKKFIALLLVAVVLCTLIGCSGKGTCESCKTKNVTLKTVEVDGEKAKLCENCAKLVDGMNDIVDGLGDLDLG